jgi:hypothetical protein
MHSCTVCSCSRAMCLNSVSKRDASVSVDVCAVAGLSDRLLNVSCSVLLDRAGLFRLVCAGQTAHDGEVEVEVEARRRVRMGGMMCTSYKDLMGSIR